MSPSLDANSLSFEAQINKYQVGEGQVASTTIVADLDTPVSAYLKLSVGEEYSCLLESVEGGENRGRYSIIGLRPDIVWRAEGDKVSIRRNALTNQTYEQLSQKPLESLRALQQESLIDLPHPLPPMAAGIVGYMGYDMVRQMEDIGDGKPDPLGMSTSIFIRPTVMAIFDSVTNLITLVTPVRPDADVDAHQALQNADRRLEEMLERLDSPLPLNASIAAPSIEDASSNTSRERFFDMVAKAQEYILSGDIFSGCA